MAVAAHLTPPHTHTRAQYGQTALIRAVREDHADCARLLLDAGANTEATDMVRDRSAAFAVSARLCVLGRNMVSYA